jgi:glucose-6-phosphate 1-dehydrogenase
MSDTLKAPSLDPSIIVIFGITGDLSQRYLLPALFHLIKHDLVHEKTEIIGISRRDVNVDDMLKDSHLFDDDEAEQYDNNPAVDKFKQHLRMIKMDLTGKPDYEQLRIMLDKIEDEQGVCMNRLYYLSIPPQVYSPIIRLMGETGLNTTCKHGAAMSRLLIEKPFGYDLGSAESLIYETGQVFGEDQMFRIDHYLAKETVQNILTFRFKNPIFESIWNNQHVASIEISASEKIGIEGRANFYEPICALRDFVQSHLSQVMAIITMDQPETMDSDHIHAKKQAVFNQVKAVPADHVDDYSWRGQYAGYKQEVENDDSNTETFAAIRVQIDSDRWRGVPITLWTGKSLQDKSTLVKMLFKGQAEQPNELRFRIQPNEGIELDLLTKKPGFDTELQTAPMDFSYQHNFAETNHPNAYERVLVDAVRGDHTLFATGQEVLAAWRIVQPVLDRWGNTTATMHEYQPGSDGEELISDLADIL